MANFHVQQFTPKDFLGLVRLFEKGGQAEYARQIVEGQAAAAAVLADAKARQKRAGERDLAVTAREEALADLQTKHAATVQRTDTELAERAALLTARELDVTTAGRNLDLRALELDQKAAALDLADTDIMKRNAESKAALDRLSDELSAREALVVATEKDLAERLARANAALASIG